MNSTTLKKPRKITKVTGLFKAKMKSKTLYQIRLEGAAFDFCTPFGVSTMQLQLKKHYSETIRALEEQKA